MKLTSSETPDPNSSPPQSLNNQGKSRIKIHPKKHVNYFWTKTEPAFQLKVGGKGIGAQCLMADCPRPWSTAPPYNFHIAPSIPTFFPLLASFSFFSSFSNPSSSSLNVMQQPHEYTALETTKINSTERSWPIAKLYNLKTRHVLLLSGTQTWLCLTVRWVKFVKIDISGLYSKTIKSESLSMGSESLYF